MPDPPSTLQGPTQDHTRKGPPLSCLPRFSPSLLSSLLSSPLVLSSHLHLHFLLLRSHRALWLETPHLHSQLPNLSFLNSRPGISTHMAPRLLKHKHPKTSSGLSPHKASCPAHPGSLSGSNITHPLSRSRQNLGVILHSFLFLIPCFQPISRFCPLCWQTPSHSEASLPPHCQPRSLGTTIFILDDCDVLPPGLLSCPSPTAPHVAARGSCS